MTASRNQDAPYLDPQRPARERASDLLDRMTVEEKLAQLGSVWVFQIAAGVDLDPGRAAPLLEHGIGHITRISGASSLTGREAAGLANQVQRHLRDRTRLGIPAIVHEEICAGLMARGAVAFPQAIGVAATFRPEHARAMADTIRRQMRAIGAHQGLSPAIDICRDPRWGRLEETYGEDPFLTSQMGMAFVEGLQGTDLTHGVAATAKHFVGHGASEGGLNWAPSHLPERELRDVHLRPFEAAVRVSGLASVMNAYHELDGVPCGASRWLLTELLRDEWGFEGTVVSDYFAVRQLADYHRVVADGGEAAVAALEAGIDVELPSTDCFGQPLADLVAAGEVTMASVDLAVRRVLETKFRLGLFERPFVDVDGLPVSLRTTEQVELADAVAADSIVLLHNDGILPLRSVRSVAVIGPNADSARNLLGDYSYASHVESLLEVLKSGRNVFSMPVDRGVDVDPVVNLDDICTIAAAIGAALPEVDLRVERGCGVSDLDRSGFAAAVRAARESDVAVMVMGDMAGLTEECTSGESRDVAHLALPGIQEELVHEVAATGTPVILVLVAGRPIGSEAVHRAASAVVMAWLPGERGGSAVAGVLTGAVNPGGRLPVTYPRSSGQVPVYYGHKVSGGRSHWKGSYVDLSNEPLYPFGHGLSYTEFRLEASGPAGEAVLPGDVVTVTVDVHNVGDQAGDEVVQLYSRDPVASITRPVLELQAFQRVGAEPGGAVRVTFRVPVEALGFTGRDMAYVLEPGLVEFLVGTSSSNVVLAGQVQVAVDSTLRTRRAMTVSTDVSAL